MPSSAATPLVLPRVLIRAAALALALGLAACAEDFVGPADGPLRFVSVSAGDAHSCAISSAGITWCWGTEAMARLGFLSDEEPCSGDACLEPVQTFGSIGFDELSAGGGHNCGLADDVAYCWGWGWHGQIGDANTLYQRCITPDGDDPLPCTIDPVPVALGFGVVDVSAGGEHSCAVTTGRDAYCWGLNQFAQLGTGDTVITSTPTLVAGDLEFTSISTGVSHTCGLVADGTAWCWGSNEGGRLGDNSIGDSPVPVPVIGDMRWRTIDAGHTHNCGIAVDGLAYCWGTARGGRLGNGADTVANGPVLVRLSVGPVWHLSAGDGHTCAIAGAAHDVYCWGYGFAGQLGNNRQSERPFPDRAQVDGPFRSVSAGKLHSCAVHDDGRMFCWGANESGQLGIGSMVNQAVPHPVAHDPLD